MAGSVKQQQQQQHARSLARRSFSCIPDHFLECDFLFIEDFFLLFGFVCTPICPIQSLPSGSSVTRMPLAAGPQRQ